MAERVRNGRKRNGSAINKLLNRIAEAVGLGSSASERGVATLEETEGDDTKSETAGAIAGGLAPEAGDGPAPGKRPK